MSTALVVANTLPPQIAALKDETLASALSLATEAKALSIKDAESLAVANALYKRIDGLNKAIKEQRLEITRPIDALKDAIMDAERLATKPLSDAREDLGKRIFEMDRELARQRQLAEAKARKEAEEKAAAERARLEAERQEIIRKQQAEHAEAERAAKEQADLFGTEAEPIPEAEPPPPVVVVPVVDAVMIPPALPKSAVRGSTRTKLKIHDASKIPRDLAGVVLLIPDDKAIEKLMKAGVEVPGCHLETVEGFASAGGR